MRLYAKIAMAAAALTLGACETFPGPLSSPAPTAASAVEAADTSIEFDLETITCWEVLSAPEDATEYALTLLYGYSAGKTGANTQSGDRINTLVSAAAETCSANPDMPAYQAFR